MLWKSYLPFLAHTAHASISHSPSSFVFLIRMVFAGCYYPLLNLRPSRHYLCNPCVVVWIHTPWCLSAAFTHFFAESIGFTFAETRSAHQTAHAMQLQHGTGITRLQSFDYLQASTLTRPPGCSHRSFFFLKHRRPGRLHHAFPRWLPALGCGIVSCPTWATDTTGLSPAGLQPCRLLLPHPALQKSLPAKRASYVCRNPACYSVSRYGQGSSAKK